RWTVPAPASGRPASVTIDMGAVVPIAGISVTPSRTIAKGVAPPRDYRCETSLDGQRWEVAAAGELPNIAYALATQRIAFAAVRPARWLRLSFTETAVPADYLTLAGVGAFLKQ
ncbi:alpha-L-fucosidase, partial [Sphingomonas sp. HMWF008]